MDNQPVAMMHTKHQESDTEHRNCPLMANLPWSLPLDGQFQSGLGEMARLRDPTHVRICFNIKVKKK